MAKLNEAVETVTGVVESVTGGEEGFFDTLPGKIVKTAVKIGLPFLAGFVAKGAIDGTLKAPALPGKKQAETAQTTEDVKGEFEDAED